MIRRKQLPHAAGHGVGGRRRRDAAAVRGRAQSVVKTVGEQP